MITACAIAAALVIIASLLYVACDLIGQRDWHATNAERLAEELDAAYARLGGVLDEHELCPAPFEVADQIDDTWLELLVTRPADGPTS